MLQLLKSHSEISTHRNHFRRWFFLNVSMITVASESRRIDGLFDHAIHWNESIFIHDRSKDIEVLKAQKSILLVFMVETPWTSLHHWMSRRPISPLIKKKNHLRQSIINFVYAILISRVNYFANKTALTIPSGSIRFLFSAVLCL